MEDTRKGYLLSKMVYIRVRDWNQASNCTTSINDQYDGNVPSDGVKKLGCLKQDP